MTEAQKRLLRTIGAAKGLCAHGQAGHPRWTTVDKLVSAGLVTVVGARWPLRKPRGYRITPAGRRALEEGTGG